VAGDTQRQSQFAEQADQAGIERAARLGRDRPRGPGVRAEVVPAHGTGRIGDGAGPAIAQPRGPVVR
jgi:hypothetical protein